MDAPEIHDHDIRLVSREIARREHMVRGEVAASGVFHPPCGGQMSADLGTRPDSAQQHFGNLLVPLFQIATLREHNDVSFHPVELHDGRLFVLGRRQ